MPDNWTPANGNLVHWKKGIPKNVGIIGDVINHMVQVQFDSGEKKTFAWPSTVLERVLFKPGDHVQMQSSHEVGIVLGVIKESPLAIYQVSLPSGKPKVDESGLRRPIITDPIELLREGEVHRSQSTNLRIAATRLLLDYQFNEFSSLSNARVEIKPHQVAVLHRVATSYPHRFLLADEVGLGKTIEAGMVIKELKARGLANRVLILAPSGLVGQWQMEMKSKFGLVFSRYTRETTSFLQSKYPGEDVWTLEDNIIASTTFAALDENRRRAIVLAPWDLVVIDEAHHARRTLKTEDGVRYSETQLYKLVEALARLESGGTTGLLMLTATPMQLHQFELYSLIELLDPALFANYFDFEQNRQASRVLNLTVKQIRRWPELTEAEKHSTVIEAARCLEKPTEDTASMMSTPAGRSQLEEDLFSRHRLSEVLVRNRKATVGGFMPRAAAILEVNMTEHERAAYNAVRNYASDGYVHSERTGDHALGFLMATFQKINSSSSFAVRHSLIKRIEKLQKKLGAQPDANGIEDQDLEEKRIEDALGNQLGLEGRGSIVEEIENLANVVRLLDLIDTDSKAKVLVQTLAKLTSQDQNIKVLIFTQFRDTQDYLKSQIPAPWAVHLYHGSLKPAEKDDVVKEFRDGKGPQVMISTEAGGEGRNFQFCHTMVNYDLPWNPMKVEQRIGRLDRIGQKHPITILNFKLVGTIEERVLDVLDKRIKIFEETVGGLDPILGDVESEIRDIMLRASYEAEQALKLLGEQLEQRVHSAREAERQLADLIMDVKSFRQDEVKKLLEHRGTLDNKTMQYFVQGILKELGATIKTDPELPGVFFLRYYDRFLDKIPKLTREELPVKVTFDPSVAIDYESIDFLAFGHKLVDALVDYVRSKNYLASTSHQVMRTNERPPIQGWFFTYLLEFEGVTPRKELFPIFVDSHGKPDEELADWLLDRSCSIDEEEPSKDATLECDESFERATKYAENRALERMSERHEELALANVEKLNQLRAKLERAYDHRQKAAAAKLASVQRVLERVSASDDPEVQKIIPVWAKNLDNARKHKEEIDRDRERSFRDLEVRKEASGRYEIFTASFVEVVPESISSETDSAGAS